MNVKMKSQHPIQKCPTNIDRYRNQRGFTLIETMVALGIILIVSTSILTLFTRGLRTTGTAKYMTSATYVAKSHLEEIKSTDFGNITLTFAEDTPTAVSDSTLPSGTTWTVSYPDGTNADPLTITVTVEWPEDGETKSVNLTTQVTSHEDTE